MSDLDLEPGATRARLTHRRVGRWLAQHAGRAAELAVLVLVLSIAATISYSHLRQVWGDGWSSYLGPLSVDGLFAAAWLRIRRRRRHHQPVGKLAWLALYLALTATVLGNLAAADLAWLAANRVWLDRIVAVWPAVAFAVVWELLVGLDKRRRDEPPPEPAAEPKPAPVVEAPAEPEPARPVVPLVELDVPLPPELIEDAARLADAGAGRGRLARELGIGEKAARTFLERYRASQPPAPALNGSAVLR